VVLDRDARGLRQAVGVSKCSNVDAVVDASRLGLDTNEIKFDHLRRLLSLKQRIGPVHTVMGFFGRSKRGQGVCGNRFL
jgi:hypothetical protein